MRRTAFEFLFLCGIFFSVLGGKLILIEHAGSDLPTMDQWDAEAEVIIKPWIEGCLGKNELIHAHNEHRLVTTKLYVLALFVINQQWDALVEMTGNAIIHSLCAVILILIGSRWLTARPLLVFSSLVGLLFILPTGWGNTLFGFQVQFYFLIAFSLVHIWFTLEADTFSWRWLAGQAAAVMALFTNASGFFSSIAVLWAIAFSFAKIRRLTRQQVTTVGFSLMLFFFGYLLKNDVAVHEILKAVSFGQLLDRTILLLTWPGTAFHPWSLMLIAPAVVFVIYKRPFRWDTIVDPVLVGLFSWVLVQIAAVAYARGNGDFLASRYTDILIINVALQFVFIVSSFSKKPRIVVGGIWLIAVLVSMAGEARRIWKNDLPALAAQSRRHETNVRSFVSTNDTNVLLGKSTADIPYPVADTLIKRLSNPGIQSVLPVSVRRPVPIASGGSKAPVEVPGPLAGFSSPVAASTWNVAVAEGGFHWRSATQPDSSLAILRFQVAGDLGEKGKALRLVVKSASDEVLVIPASVAGLRWKNVSISRPPGEWWIEAVDGDASGWFAFTEPVEVGRLTWTSGKLIKNCRWVFVLGVILLLLGATPFLRRVRWMP